MWEALETVKYSLEKWSPLLALDEIIAFMFLAVFQIVYMWHLTGYLEYPRGISPIYIRRNRVSVGVNSFSGVIAASCPVAPKLPLSSGYCFVPPFHSQPCKKILDFNFILANSEQSNLLNIVFICLLSTNQLQWNTTEMNFLSQYIKKSLIL